MYKWEVDIKKHQSVKKEKKGKIFALVVKTISSAYWWNASLGKVLSKVFCSSAKKFAQFADPGQAKWHTKQSIENAKNPSWWGFWGNIAIT